jgi:hypothetical protein
MTSHDRSHSLCRPERLDHIVGPGGDADLRQDRVDEEPVMRLGMAGAAIGHDDDPVARIGTGAGRGLHYEVGPHAHQHQRLDALGAEEICQRRAVERVDAVLGDDEVPGLGRELRANLGPRRAGLLLLEQRDVGRGVGIVVAEGHSDVDHRRTGAARGVEHPRDGLELMLLAIIGCRGQNVILKVHREDRATCARSVRTKKACPPGRLSIQKATWGARLGYSHRACATCDVLR